MVSPARFAFKDTRVGVLTWIVCELGFSPLMVGLLIVVVSACGIPLWFEVSEKVDKGNSHNHYLEKGA